jgi:hypothetical protein
MVDAVNTTPATDAEIAQLPEADRLGLLAKFGSVNDEFRIEAKQWFHLCEAIKNSVAFKLVGEAYDELRGGND